LPPPQNFRLSILDNRPAPGQVFALFDARDNAPPDPSLTGIWITTEGNRLHKIAIWNRNSDWILFPIMFPAATQTYGKGILRSNIIATDSLPDNDAELLQMIDQEAEFAVPTPQHTAGPPAPAQLQPAADSVPLASLIVPTVEPSTWNDAIETTDIEIPEAVTSEDVIDISDDEEVADDSPDPQETR
jgi:hypothetical protein